MILGAYFSKSFLQNWSQLFYVTLFSFNHIPPPPSCYLYQLFYYLHHHRMLMPTQFAPRGELESPFLTFLSILIPFYLALSNQFMQHFHPTLIRAYTHHLLVFCSPFFGSLWLDRLSGVVVCAMSWHRSLLLVACGTAWLGTNTESWVRGVELAE